MGTIYVFHMLLQIDSRQKFGYDRLCLPALGFSGITNLEDDLHRIGIVAWRHEVGRFLTHYPHLDLVVATARPHFDQLDKNEFQKMFFRSESRYITRKDLLVNCPSLSKFNGCLTCSHSLGSLPCFIKAMPNAGKQDSHFLRTDDLTSSYYKKPPSVQTHYIDRDMLLVPTSHATNWRSRSDIIGVGNIGTPFSIAENIKSASDAAKKGHVTKTKIAEHCPQCYFRGSCHKRWRVERCSGAYSKEKVIASLVEKVTYTCREAGLSIDELKYFINAGGHEVYPSGAQLTFRGLNRNFTHGVFYTKYGRNVIRHDLPHTRRLLQARFYHDKDYTHAVKPSRHCEVPNEMLGVYYELCRVDHYKTSYGWCPYSKIKSLSIGRDETMRIDFFSRSALYIRHYSTLNNQIQGQLTELML